MRGLRALAVGLVLAGALALAAAGVAGGPALKLTVARHADGPYKPEISIVQIDSKSKDFYFRVKNIANGMQAMRMEDARGGDDVDDFRIRWYRGDEEITDEARGAGYEFDLGAFESRKFRVNVKPKVANPGAACVAATFYASPSGDIEGTGVQVNDNNQCG